MTPQQRQQITQEFECLGFTVLARGEHHGVVHSLHFIDKDCVSVVVRPDKKQCEVAFQYHLFNCTVTLAYPHKRLNTFIEKARQGVARLNGCAHHPCPTCQGGAHKDWLDHVADAMKKQREGS